MLLTSLPGESTGDGVLDEGWRGGGVGTLVSVTIDLTLTGDCRGGGDGISCVGEIAGEGPMSTLLLNFLSGTGDLGGGGLDGGPPVREG